MSFKKVNITLYVILINNLIGVGFIQAQQDPVPYFVQPSFYDSLVAHYGAKKIYSPIYQYEKQFQENIPHVSWGVVWSFWGDMEMLSFTHDKKYLDNIILHIDTLLKHRDDRTGRKNWQGIAAPLWSAGSRYGFGQCTLRSEQKEPVLLVHTYGYWYPDKPEPLLRTRNSKTLISVVTDKADSFMLIIENSARDYLDTFRLSYSKNIRKGTILMDNGTVKVTLLKDSPKIRKDFPVQQYQTPADHIYNDYIVGTALLLKPITYVIRYIHDNNLPDHYQKKAALYLNMVKQTYNYIEMYWYDVSNNHGYYGSVKGQPNGRGYINGRPLPFNQLLEFSYSLTDMFIITQDSFYLSKAKAIANYFKGNLLFDSLDSVYIWQYWSWEGFNNIEPLNYATLDLRAVLYLYKHNIVFTSNDIKYFVNTITKKIIKENDEVAYRVNGEGRYGNSRNFARLAPFCEFDKRIFDVSVKMLRKNEAHFFTDDFYQTRGKLFEVATTIRAHQHLKSSKE